MTVRTFVIGAAVMAVAASAIWTLVFNFLDPDQAGTLGFLLFFLSLFVAIASIVSLIGFGLRRLIMAQQLAAYSVRTSLRQSIIVSAFLNALLLLQLLRLYRWWLALILLFISVFIELVFLSYDRTQSRRANRPAA